MRKKQHSFVRCESDALMSGRCSYFPSRTTCKTSSTSSTTPSRATGIPSSLPAVETPPCPRTETGGQGEHTSTIPPPTSKRRPKSSRLNQRYEVRQEFTLLDLGSYKSSFSNSISICCYDCWNIHSSINNLKVIGKLVIFLGERSFSFLILRRRKHLCIYQEISF